MFISNLSIIDRVDFQAAQTKMALVYRFHTVLFCILRSIICLRHKHKETLSYRHNKFSLSLFPPKLISPNATKYTP